MFNVMWFLFHVVGPTLTYDHEYSVTHKCFVLIRLDCVGQMNNRWCILYALSGTSLKENCTLHFNAEI